MLYDWGFSTILPEQMYQYMNGDAVFPAKFFIQALTMCVWSNLQLLPLFLINMASKQFFYSIKLYRKKNYLDAAQIKILSDQGHMIAVHGFDHRNITTISGNEWERRISKPLLLLEKITGKPENCFAYPFGAWNETAIAELKKRGIKMAFQLMTGQSKNEPLFTIRRLMISGLWTPVELERRLAAVF